LWRCFRQIVLGTQEVAYSGDTSYRPLVLFGWELMEEPTADGKPQIVQKRYSASMHEKTTLRKDIDAWRGKKFVEADLRGPKRFDTKS
jgi:hypothetical protein